MSADDATKVIVPLATFAENGLRAIYTATTKRAFDDAFNAFYSTRVAVTLNGKEIAQAEFREQLWSTKNDERRGTVSFAGVVQASADEENPDSVSRLRSYIVH